MTDAARDEKTFSGPETVYVTKSWSGSGHKKSEPATNRLDTLRKILHILSFST